MKFRYSLMAVLLLGGSFLIYGLYIPAKAVVAQLMLENAWDNAQSGGLKARPWTWADTYPVARLKHPRLGIDQIVLAGASGRVLAFGPGHVQQSAAVGSQGNVVLSGHRDTHFSWLQAIKKGDHLELELPNGKKLNYAVLKQSVHDESELELLEADNGQGLRLITCYPFNALIPGGRQRFLIDAVLM